MDEAKKIRLIANSFYNLGLEQARVRNLTGAAESLKKSLHFNKYQTDARNLLGLIYYEIGEVADALVQWVISMNLQPQDNRAEVYLGRLQSKGSVPEAESRAIKKYNQGLLQAQNRSNDLAILQLTKAVALKPAYIRAQLLLALLYMEQGDLGKAGKCVSKVLQTDRNNPKAIFYKSLIKGNGSNPKKKPALASGETDRPGADHKKMRNVFSHRQMEDDDIILPPSYREFTRDQAVVNIIVGLVIGAAVIFLLVMPANTKAVNVRHNQEMLEYSEKLSKSSQEAAGLKSQIELLEAQKQEAEDSLNNLTTNEDSILSQYQTIIGILWAYKNNDFPTAVELFASLSTSAVTEQSVLDIVNEVNMDMQANGYQVLEGKGDQAAVAGKKDIALDYYQKSLNLKEDNWQVKYKMAQIYKDMNQKEQANALFTDIIDNSRDEELTAKSKVERGF